jgi:hypothetical protein
MLAGGCCAVTRSLIVATIAHDGSFTTMSEGGPQPKPEIDVYTTLLATAVLFVAVATAVMMVQSHTFFGTWFSLGGV